MKDKTAPLMPIHQKSVVSTRIRKIDQVTTTSAEVRFCFKLVVFLTLNAARLKSDLGDLGLKSFTLFSAC